MIALVPIFSKSNKKLWLSSDGQKLMHQTLSVLKTCPQLDECIVFTDMETVAQLAEKVKLEVQIIKPEPETDASVLLPRGALTCVKFMKDTSKSKDKHLAIFNFRNTLITQRQIDAATREFFCSGVPLLLSVKKAVDHPVQLERFSKIVEVGTIHLFEREDYPLEDNLSKDDALLVMKPYDRKNKVNGDRRYLVTKPFFFDWASRGETSGPQWSIYKRHISESRIEFTPAAHLKGKMHDQPTRVLWIYDTTDTARLLVIPEAIGPKGVPMDKRRSQFRLKGISLSDDHSTLRHQVFFDPKKCRSHLNFQFDEVPPGPYTLKLFPFGSGISKENSAVVVIAIEDLSMPLVLDELEEGINGMIYALLRTINDGSYDFREPFPPPPDLWAIEIDSGKKINCITGKEITGRQDFPDVFIPDGSFFFMAKDVTQSLERVISSGRAIGFVMEQDDSIQINSTLDYLRYRAIKRAQRETTL